ncbi:MAG: competence/damage-inducible protein A [Chloroflexi bacterium]|nr:competence/damage-inducible protein A [Chloroflexota bacterium]
MDQQRDGHAPGPVELYSIGTELVMGRIYDTNSFWIAEQLAKIGVYPRRITCLPDDPAEIHAAFADARQRGTGVVITTGGLGPTPDDLTVECVARVVAAEVVVDQATIASFMRRRNLTDPSQVSPGLRKMATVPAGALIYQNPAGWAPLIAVAAEPTRFFLMPGPPREMQAIYQHHLAGILGGIFRTTTSACRVVVDMFESEVSPLLQEVMAQHPKTYLKAYVALRNDDGMPVDVVAHGDDQPTADARLQAAIQFFRDLAVAKNRTVRSLET